MSDKDKSPIVANLSVVFLKRVNIIVFITGLQFSFVYIWSVLTRIDTVYITCLDVIIDLFNSAECLDLNIFSKSYVKP